MQVQKQVLLCQGFFISFEGIDGCGKTTQAQLLTSELEEQGYEVMLVREPGGTLIGERIRSLLLDPNCSEMSDECELLLYEASRAQLVEELIKPALKRGAIVICDRFFDSTYAYQHGGRGLDADLVNRCNELGSCGLVPQLTLLLDLDAPTALRRATKGGADRLEAEGLAFQERVRNAYLELAHTHDERIVVLDADAQVDEVYQQVKACVTAHVPRKE